MSVIGLNLWINFQVLKSTYQQLDIKIKSQLRQLYKQTNNKITNIIQYMYRQIHKRDTIIRQLTKSHNIQNNINNKQQIRQQQYVCEIDRMDMQNLQNKCKQLIHENQQYKKQFIILMTEMKNIKVYLQQLRQIKNNNITQQGKLQQNNNNQHNRQQQTIKQILTTQDKILQKINSINKLDCIKNTQILDTIKQVTQISIHTQQEQQQLQQQQTQIQYFNPTIYQQITQSKSFQCISQTQDIKNTLFYNNSRQISNHLPNQSYQTFQHSLSVLKNYCNYQNTIYQEQIIDFTIMDLDQLAMPILLLKQIVNLRYLIFCNGFIYTGNTVTLENQVRPMGFGQLFYNHRLVYCGQWKDGIFDGWGKLYFSQDSKIKNFNGKWVRGQATGSSTIKFWNNDKFIGTLKNNKANGDGIYYRKNQIFLRGYWKNNKFVKSQ